MMRKALVLIIISLVCISSIAALDRPAILVKGENGEYKPLRISKLRIETSVIGNLALTTMDITFSNDLNRVLEGQFYFPLSEGKTVTRFALDVNGALREGVIVEREKGRAVYESTIRQNIDPGLLEWSKGNNFKARIYPVPAKGHKRLVIAYEQELTAEEEGFLYLLPLEFKDKVDVFSVKVEVFKQNVEPEFSSTNELINLSFKKWKESYIAEMEEKNYLPDKQLAFILPKTKAYKQVSIEEADGSTYFYVHLNPEIKESPKTLPGKICLLWDASFSSEKREYQREFDLLERYLEACGNVGVEVVIFRNEVEKSPRLFTIKKGNWGDLKSYLLSIPVDGGTQLGSLDLNNYTCDEFILVSDGISTFGARDMSLSSTPVNVINSQLTAGHSYLNYIARKTGGVYINLKNISNNEALHLLKNTAYSFIRAEYNDNQIKEVFPGLPVPVTRDFSITGMMTSKKAEITLHFGIGNKTMYSTSLSLDSSSLKSESGLIPRIWAEKKITELDMQYEKNRDEIIGLGKKYSMVTRETSLIVLDRIEDYIANRIIPPKEMQA
ncbi:MAG: hypothetical protein JXJ04_15520, partial [Spirochaetales bacterium]|nr:hypothetical protein [Spirochaetales bacterium]